MAPTPVLEPPARRVRTTDVCELAGVTYRVLDYWLRLGLFRMADAQPGSGFARRWRPIDVVAAQVAGRLARLDAPTSALARAVNLVYDAGGVPLDAAQLVVEPAGGAWYAEAGVDPHGPAWVIPVADLVE